LRASDFFLKLDSSPGVSIADSLSLQGIMLSGGLSVTAKVAAKMSIDSLGCDSAYLKLDSSIATSRSSLSLTQVDCAGTIDVICLGACDISAGSGGGGGGGSGGSLGRFHAVDLVMELYGVSGQQSPSSVILDDLDLDGTLDVLSQGSLDFTMNGSSTNADGTVRSPGGLRATDLFMKISDLQGSPARSRGSLTDLVLSGQLNVVTGGGDDILSISDSHVNGPAMLDGGNGNDTLRLSRNSFAVAPVEISWETIELKGA
jgi:hypothetical protein